MNLILLGPPGAGKGTQAVVLSREFGLVHISTGDILRDEVKNKSALGEKVAVFMHKGDLVPDEIVTEVIISRIRKPDTQKGFVLDGFPRTREQAESLGKAVDELGVKIDRVLYFETMPEVSVERLTGRRVCSACGANYHIKNIPPKKEGICDKCGGRLIQRRDDTAETVKERLKVYNEKTRSLIGYYNDKGMLTKVSGDLSVDELFGKLEVLFKKKGLL